MTDGGAPEDSGAHAAATQADKGKRGKGMNDENQEIISLPDGGKVTGKLVVVWLAGNKARVRSESEDYVSFRNREWRVSAVFGQNDAGEWVHESESYLKPVEERGNTSVWDTTPKTFRKAILDAVTAALAEAWTVDKARTAGRIAAESDVSMAERRVRELESQLSDERAKLAAARRRLALFQD